MPEPRDPEEEGGGLIWRFPEGYSAEELPKALPDLLRRMGTEPPAVVVGPGLAPDDAEQLRQLKERTAALRRLAAHNPEAVTWLGNTAPPDWPEGKPPPKPGEGVDMPDGDLLVRFTRSTFGDASTEAEQSVVDALPTVLANAITPAELPQAVLDLEDELLADFQLVQAGGRWRPMAYDPESFVPGDVVALRYFALAPNMRRVDAILAKWASGESLGPPEDRLLLLWHARTVTSLCRTVQHAASYFLPVESAASILAATPPDEELRANLRLPFGAVTVYFGADLAIPPEFQQWSEHLDTSRERSSRLLDALVAPEPYSALPPGREHQARRDLTQAMRDLGGHLSGVTLLANPDGTLADQVIWTVATNLDPAFAGTPLANDRMRGIIDGYLPASTLAPLVYNLAAAVCWGAWTQPPPPPDLPEAGTRPWRKAWKSGALKRAEKRGQVAGVRVIDLAKMTAPKARAQPDPTRPTRRSPVPHPRRGHWRRSRVGPRDDWHYVGHFIPGRMVSLAGGQPPQPGRPTVYQLPVPEGTPGAEALDTNGDTDG